MKALENGNAMNVYAQIAETQNRFDNKEENMISRSCIGNYAMQLKII